MANKFFKEVEYKDVNKFNSDIKNYKMASSH